MEYEDLLPKVNRSVTENGAIGYRTTGKQLLDFLWKAPSLRNARREELEREFRILFNNVEEILVIKFLFFMRDIREGQGERHIFQEAVRFLAKNKPDILCKIFDYHLISFYGRWDDMLILLDEDGYDSNLMGHFYGEIRTQFYNDIKAYKAGKEISLLAKWLPSINADNKTTIARAKKLCKNLFIRHKDYRQNLAKLRKYTNVVERDMSDNNWSGINYSYVPSLANLRYQKAFLRHDEERRIKYLNDVKNNKATINASVLAPHEIVHKYGVMSNDMPYNEDLEILWDNLPKVALEDTIVVRDGSGSMDMVKLGKTNVKPLDVSTALAIYLSHGLKGSFKDRFITFSKYPQLVDCSQCETLHEKLVLCYRHDDYSNTDIQAVFELILNAALRNGLSKSEMPKNILIISDMEFDSIRDSKEDDKILFEKIKKDYQRAGYNLPRLIFWNVSSRSNTIPLIENENGVILMSGYSTQSTKIIMTGEIDPYKALMSVLGSERYSKIDDLYF